MFKVKLKSGKVIFVRWKDMEGFVAKRGDEIEPIHHKRRGKVRRLFEDKAIQNFVDIKAQELDEKFDNGEDITEYLDLKNTYHGLGREYENRM